jgi:hypothetical protein
VLDVCAPAPAARGSVEVDALGLLGGRLERHVVARSDAQAWMGKAAYRMAKQAHWGDLWPAFYNLNPKRQVVPPPVAPGLYEEDEEEEEEEEEEQGGNGRSAAGLAERLAGAGRSAGAGAGRRRLARRRHVPEGW